MGKPYVGGSGPFTAKLLFIGEAPGREEERRGEPFVGATGQRVRGFIRAAGLDPATDVRFNNAIGYNLGSLPSSAGALRRIVDEHRGNLDSDLATCSAKVIVACGRASLYRLVGRMGINMETGGVIPWRMGNRSVLVVPTVHPASVMHQKIGAGWLLVETAITRACRLARGDITYPNPELRFTIEYPAAEQLDAVLAAAKVVAIDTEFDRNTSIPFLCGLTTDGKKVWSFSPTADRCAVLAKHLARPDLVKVMHYCPADITALRQVGVDVAFPLWDTLGAFAMLYPDLDVGLSHVARFYLDGVENWKGMSHDEPLYNALDVMMTWHIKVKEQEELAETDMLKTFLEVHMPMIPLLMAMEDRGIWVSPANQEMMIKENSEESERLCEAIELRVGEVFAARGDPTRAQIAAREREIEELLAGFKPCEVHQGYTGSTKPRKRKIDAEMCPGCVAAYLRGTEERGRVKKLRNERSALRTRLSKWEKRGFNPGNHHDLKWLLYDKGGFALPKQWKGKGTEHRLSSDVDAIAKLLAHKRTEKPEFLRQLLRDISEYQHLAKVRSTFLVPKTDRWNLVHPEYRWWGTGTGRLAGGSDTDAVSDKARSRYSMSLMNIDREARIIYAPRPRVLWGDAVQRRDDEGEGDRGDEVEGGDREDEWADQGAAVEGPTDAHGM